MIPKEVGVTRLTSMSRDVRSLWKKRRVFVGGHSFRISGSKEECCQPGLGLLHIPQTLESAIL